MKTLKEVHDMLVLTGYKEEAETVADAIKVVEMAAVFNRSIEKISELCQETHEEVMEVMLK